MKSVAVLRILLCLTKLTNQPPVAAAGARGCPASGGTRGQRHSGLPPYLPEDAGGRGQHHAVLCDGSLRGQGDLGFREVDDGVHLQGRNPAAQNRAPGWLAQAHSFHPLPAHAREDLAI